MSELNTAANNIYDRLRNAPTFHPANADLFTDWNIQAGDVVNIKSDDTTYQVPVYNMKLKWSGAPKVNVESTGNPEREPLPAIKRREYSANSSNYSTQKRLGGGISNALEQTAEINGVLYAAGLQIDPVTGVWLYASEHGEDYALGSSFKVQSDAISAEVTRATAAEGTLSGRITTEADRITAEVTRATAAEDALSGRLTVQADRITAEVTRAQGAEETLSGRLTITENAITQEVTDRTNADSTLSGRITTEANRITAEVTRAQGAEETLAGRLTITENAITTEVTDRTNADATLQSSITQTANQIALKVSKGDVSTQLAVECGNVTISGGNLVVSGYVTANGLKTAIAEIDVLNVKGLRSFGNIVAEGNVVANGAVYLQSGQSLTDVAGAVASFGTASASGGQISIPTTTLGGTAGPTINFNIADTQYYKNGVSAAWTNAYNTVRVNNNGSGTAGPGNKTITLSPGDTVEVYAQAKQTSGAAIWNTVGTVTVTASGSGDTYSPVNYARKNLNATNIGRKALYYYDDNADRYVSATGNSNTYYWYYSSSSGWDTLYEKD